MKVYNMILLVISSNANRDIIVCHELSCSMSLSYVPKDFPSNYQKGLDIFYFALGELWAIQHSSSLFRS